MLTRWLDQVKETREYRIWARYECVPRLYIIPRLGRIPLVQLTRDDVQQFVNQISRKQWKNVAHYCRLTLRAALNVVVEDGDLHRNVAGLTEPPRRPESTKRPLRPEEVDMFLEAVRGDRMEAMYVLGLGTGLREGSASGCGGKTWTWRTASS